MYYDKHPAHLSSLLTRIQVLQSSFDEEQISLESHLFPTYNVHKEKTC